MFLVASSLCILFSHEQTFSKNNNLCIWNKNKFWCLVEGFAESKQQTLISFNHQYYFVNMQRENSKNVQSRKYSFTNSDHLRSNVLLTALFCNLSILKIYYHTVQPLLFSQNILNFRVFFKANYLEASIFATNLFSMEIPDQFIFSCLIILAKLCGPNDMKLFIKVSCT